ncbi:MAG: PaaI family thioesterase [Clostridia bacterium]|nr:PaaI family thioesterase [Clostridia bacterium]
MDNKRKLNPEHLKQVIALPNSCPYYRLLGVRILEIGPGFSRVELDVEDKLMNPFGSVHGGAYASLIDVAAYWSTYCDRAEDAGCTSLDLNVTNLAMTRSGKLTAVGRAVKVGRSVCMTEVEVHDDTGRLVAHGTSKLLMLQGRQSFTDLMRAAGCPQLPDKYLD